MAKFDQFAGLLQGVNSGIDSFLQTSDRNKDRALREQELQGNRDYQKEEKRLEREAREAEKKGLLEQDKVKRDEDQKFQLEKLDKEYKLKGDLEKLKPGKSGGGGLIGGGKVVPAGEASSLGQANSAVGSIQAYSKRLADNQDIAGSGFGKKLSRGFESAAGLIGEPSEVGQRLQGLQAERDATAQVVGSYLEGGKLTDTDFQRYKNMLPNESDSPSVVKAKEEALTALISSRQESQKASLGGAGYNVRTIPGVQGSSGPTQPKMITVIAPDGRPKLVPESQVQQALGAGGRLK